MTERLICRKDHPDADTAVLQYSFRPEALPGSVNKHPRRKRYLVLGQGRGLRLVGQSDEKKQVLHAASLLLSASDARLFAERQAVWSRAAQPPNVTWLD